MSKLTDLVSASREYSLVTRPRLYALAAVVIVPLATVIALGTSADVPAAVPSVQTPGPTVTVTVTAPAAPTPARASRTPACERALTLADQMSANAVDTSQHEGSLKALTDRMLLVQYADDKPQVITKIVSDINTLRESLVTDYQRAGTLVYEYTQARLECNAS